MIPSDLTLVGASLPTGASRPKMRPTAVADPAESLVLGGPVAALKQNLGPVVVAETKAISEAAPAESPRPVLKNRQVLVQEAGMDALPCRRAGTTTISHDGQPVEATVYQLEHPDGFDSYKISVGDKMVGYITLGRYRMEDGKYAGLESCPEWSPLARFGEKLYPDVYMVEMMTAPGQLEGYGQVGTRLHQIGVEHALAKGAEGLGLISSWNSQGFHYKSGYRATDYAGIPKGSEADAYIKEQLRLSPDDPHTEALGCIQMYLPHDAIKRHTEEFRENPILAKGEVTLRARKTGMDVTAKVVHESDPFGLDRYTLKVGDETVGDVALNFFQNDSAKGYHDVVGSYGPWSPFSRYGNGKKAEFNADKVYLELDNSQGEDKYRGIQESLYQIAIEASHERGCQGRIQMEGDWNEHGWLYEYGFRCQDFAGLTQGSEINRYIETELRRSQEEGRPAVCKGLGSIGMMLTREQALARVSSQESILGSIPPRDAAHVNEKTELPHNARDYSDSNSIYESNLDRAHTKEDGYLTLHMRMTADYSERFAKALDQTAYSLLPSEKKALQDTGDLFDLGKIDVDDQILQRQGGLSEADAEEISRHVRVRTNRFPDGADPKMERIFSAHSYYTEREGVREIIRHHHERWDGQGYPDGLKGHDIPLTAQITGLCDTWDSLTTRRPWRAAQDYDSARGSLLELADSGQFNRELVDLFLAKVVPDKEAFQQIEDQRLGFAGKLDSEYHWNVMRSGQDTETSLGPGYVAWDSLEAMCKKSSVLVRAQALKAAEADEREVVRTLHSFQAAGTSSVQDSNRSVQIGGVRLRKRAG